MDEWSGERKGTGRELKKSEKVWRKDGWKDGWQDRVETLSTRGPRSGVNLSARTASTRIFNRACCESITSRP